MKYYILFNPVAGKGNAADEANALSVVYSGHEIEIHNITEIKSWSEFFSAVTSEDAVVLCGGDGTLNRFINDTDGLDIPCDILYYANGSGNDFLHDVGKEPGCKPFKINDYIKDLPFVEVNGKKYRFLNNVGFGIDGYCCEVGDKQKQTSKKKVNYTAIAIKGLLFHYKTTNATVVVDGKEFKYNKVWMAPTMKGRFYGGGMMPTPKQDRADSSGMLSLLVLHDSGKLKTLMVFPSIFKGEHVKHTKIFDIHTGKDISVTFDRPTSIQIDGETILGVTSYRAVAEAIVPSPVK